MTTDVHHSDTGDPQEHPPQPRVDGDGIPRWIHDQLSEKKSLRIWQKHKITIFAVMALLTAGVVRLAGFDVVAISLSGMICLGIGFQCGIFLLRKSFSRSHPITAIARTMIEEAVNTKLSVILVLLVVVILPTLPLLLDADERLSYRVQFFLSWSLSGTMLLLAMLVISLCCHSIADDIESHQIHMAFSKPLRKWEYLLGKWLGVASISFLLVALAGIGIYTFTTVLARSNAVDSQDRLDVQEQVLTARAVAKPVHPSGDALDQSIETTIAEIRERDPALFDKNPTGARKKIISQRIHEWHTVTSDVYSSYLFQNLNEAKDRTPIIQLRLEPWADNSGISEAKVRFAMWLNERPFPVQNGIHETYTFRQGVIQTLDLPTSVIDEDGQLKITIANKNLVMAGEDVPTSISFTPGDGLEVLYRVGSFEMNFIRSLLIILWKLVMISAVALAAATWLGFPTALLTSLMVYFTATANSFFADAIDIYTGLDSKGATLTSMFRMRSRLFLERVNKFEWWEATKTIGSYLADSFLSLIPSFGNYDSITQLATGRLVPLQEVGLGFLILGIFYPSILLFAGWVLLERRDLVSTSS